MPGVYQHYLHNLLKQVRAVLKVKVMAYESGIGLDHVVKSYGFRDSFQRLSFKLGLSKHKSFDLKIMESFDIIHLQHSFLNSKILPLLNKENSPKVVITLRGADTYLRPWLSERWREFYANYGNKVAAFITMSEHQKKYLTRWGVPPDKIHVIPISFGLTSDAQPKYPNPEVLKLVSAFRMTWEKNIEGTLRFAKQLKEKNVSFQYDIYGDGHDLSQVYYFIDRFDLHGLVHVKGKIDNNELKMKLVNYDFFVQLSFSESLGMSVIEAQSVGLPCIVSDSGGLPEVVIAGKTALVKNYYEVAELALEAVALWRDKEKYFSYSREAISFVNEKFSIESETERLSNLYKLIS
jgi:glycosyltransferase involved in cell wall biosynthesis